MGGSGIAKLSGQIWQDGYAEYNNFYYTYKLTQVRFGLKSKLFFQASSKMRSLQPFLSGGVGLGFNRAFNYQATPTISEAVAAPNFTNNTATSFTYTLGVGVQKALYTHWYLGVGYEFADWGKSNLGAAPGQTVNAGIKLNHLYTNGVQFSLSFIT